MFSSHTITHKCSGSPDEACTFSQTSKELLNILTSHEAQRKDCHVMAKLDNPAGTHSLNVHYSTKKPAHRETKLQTLHTEQGGE